MPIVRCSLPSRLPRLRSLRLIGTGRRPLLCCSTPGTSTTPLHRWTTSLPRSSRCRRQSPHVEGGSICPLEPRFRALGRPMSRFRHKFVKHIFEHASTHVCTQVFALGRHDRKHARTRFYERVLDKVAALRSRASRKHARELSFQVFVEIWSHARTARSLHPSFPPSLILPVV